MQMSSTTPAPATSLRNLTNDVIAKMAVYNGAYDDYKVCMGKGTEAACSPDAVSRAYADVSTALAKLSQAVSAAMGGTGGGVGSTQDILSLYYQVILPLREKMETQAAEIRMMRGEPAEYGAPKTKLELEEQRYNAVVYMGTLVSVIAVALMFLFFRSVVRGD